MNMEINEDGVDMILFEGYLLHFLFPFPRVKPPTAPSTGRYPHAVPTCPFIASLPCKSVIRICQSSIYVSSLLFVYCRTIN